MRVLAASRICYRVRNGVARMAAGVARKLVSRGHVFPALVPLRKTLSVGSKGFRARCRNYALARFDSRTVFPHWARPVAEAVESAGRAGRSASTR